MAIVTYDESSFAIDGQRIWLVSGSLHYFRVPAELWRDRLLKAKRAGLNCVSTYVAWNFHEQQEGEWDLSGDRDIAAFVRLAGELGLYVILRPGPYICGEWDFGGLPAWLAGKSGLSYRTSNAAYTHYFDKYFRQVLPHLAELQVTRGGNIVLIQAENEYVMTTMPDRQNYLEFINQLFHRAGFEIPIISCNLFSEPPTAGTVECVNTWDRAVQDLKRMRIQQGQAPLLVTEFWAGAFDQWGGQHRTRDAVEVARRAMEVLGCGAQLNYYMWHGGTNFGFWGSRLPADHDAFQTTSYDYDAPLAEGGGLTDKYYLTRLVNLLGTHMGRFLAGCVMEEPAVSVHDSTSVLNLVGGGNRWAVVSNSGREDITTARISLPVGEEIEVPLHPFGAAAVPIGLRLVPTVALDYANLTPLGFFNDNTLVLHGPAGWEAEISLNGNVLRHTVPDGTEPTVIGFEELTIVLISSDLAMRTWFVEDTLVFGPDFVAEDLEQVQCPPGLKQYAMILPDAKVTHRKVKSATASKLSAPKLGSWKRVSVCTEPVSDELEWHKLDRPRDMDRLGVHYGYCWYQAKISHDRPRKRNLFLPDCEDRATVFLNGQFLGTWGRGDGAERKPIAADFKKGDNSVVLLADNLGRVSFGSRLGEAKGLFGPIHDAKLMRTRKFKLKQEEGFSRRIVPRQLSHLIEKLEALPVWSAEMDLPLTSVSPVHVSFTGVPHHVAVLCNERVAAFFECGGANYGDVTLGAELRKGKNKVQLLLWGDVQPKTLDRVLFHSLDEAVCDGAEWHWRPWEMPLPGGPVVGKDQPAWYAAEFSTTRRDVPLFLTILGARKGQVFLNGHNVGRFWTVGPQMCYYLPECWLQEEGNVVMIFEESGRIPSHSRLEFRPLGPYRE